MSAVSQTAASVLWSSGGEVADGTAGATIAQGNLLYFDTTTNKYKLSKSGGTAAESVIDAIALSGGSDGQPVKVLKPGTRDNPALVNLGATLDIGKIYTNGSVAGSVYPVDDVVAGQFVSTVGIATTAAILKFQPCSSGVAAASNVT